MSDIFASAPFNKSVKISGSYTEKLSSDAGAIVMRALFSLTGVISRLATYLNDYRDPARISHSFEELLRQFFLLHAQGWVRQLDFHRMRDDPLLHVAASSKAGVGALNGEKSLASQPTISRLLGMLSTKTNLSRLCRFVTTFAVEHLLQRNGGKRHSVLMIDIDGLPIDAHGRQQGSAYNGFYKRNIFLPLIASCAETGDLLGATLRAGSAHVVRDCYGFIRRIAVSVRKHAASKVIVRLDAGFNSGQLCSRLERDGLGLPCTQIDDLTL